MTKQIIDDLLAINDSICDFVKAVEKGKVIPERAEYKK